MTDIQSCGFLIVRDEPKPSFLLMKHPARWDLPKGHVDPGESDLECALRELHEETGICHSDITIDPEFCYVSEYAIQMDRYGPTAVQKRLTVFLGKLIHPVSIQVTEHEGYAWFDWNPPHEIQAQTIDPLLDQLASHWR